MIQIRRCMERALILWKEKVVAPFEEKEKVSYLTLDIQNVKAEEGQ